MDPIRELLPTSAQAWMRSSEGVPSAERGRASTQKMIDTVGNATSYIADSTPKKVGADIKGFVTANWDNLETSHAAAAAKGPEAEANWWGQVTGRATFEVAAAVVPVTKVAQLAKLDNAAGRLSSSVRGISGGTLAAERGLLSNTEVRTFYNQQLKALDTSGPLSEATAIRVHEARNALKLEARDLMSDRAAATQLAREQPVQPFQYYADKYSAQGYRDDALWQRIIQGSTTPNLTVNSKFGIK